MIFLFATASSTNYLAGSQALDFNYYWLQIYSSQLCDEFLISNNHSLPKSFIFICHFCPHRVQSCDLMSKHRIYWIIRLSRVLILIDSIIYSINSLNKVIINLDVDQVIHFFIDMGSYDIQFDSNETFLKSILDDFMTEMFVNQTCTTKFRFEVYWQSFSESILMMIVSMDQGVVYTTFLIMIKLPTSHTKSN